MTGSFLLDWATMAVSLFNTVLTLWLGLTVLLNAERRTWGIWLVGGGLLTGGAFFISHSAILGHGLTMSQGLDFWWHLGWVPVMVAPFTWYAAMLWYTGLWEDRRTALHRRHRAWLVLTILLTVVLVGLLLFANPLPSFLQAAQLDLSATPSVGGMPLLLLVYPLYLLLCLGLSLDALRRPGPSVRVMGDLARRRAGPWLIAASVALLGVGLLVAWVMTWIVRAARPDGLSGSAGMALTVARFDLAIASLVAVAIILLGRAIVSYEVFTGKTLPQRGFLRHWRNAVILAAGYGAVMSCSLNLHLRPVYSLLISAVVVVVFYALLSWRSFAERERTIEQLRPFVASQRLVEHLLAPSATAEAVGAPEFDAAPLFHALCDGVLGARVAYLVPLGPLATLVGPPLAHPEGTAVALPPLTDVAARFDSAQTMCAPLDPAAFGGATWAVPLWSERGRIGLLLLGEKRDGGLYTQEEIEIARTSGERLLDTQASAEMARRLMLLQRQRLAESQVLDRRARRTLHDDVLPRLHAAILSLSAGETAAENLAMLSDVHRRLSDLLRQMPAAMLPDLARWGLVGALRRTVEELESGFDSVTWQVEPTAEEATQALPPLTAEVLFYAAREAIRNSARHGRRGAGDPLNLRIAVTADDGLEIRVEDDGVGLATAGQSSPGGGHGLALHSTMMAVIGGTLAVESVPGASTRVTLALPRPAK